MYSAIPKYSEEIVPIQELMLGVDTMDLDDSKFGGFGFTDRKKEFINVKNNRMLSDKQSTYASVDKSL